MINVSLPTGARIHLRPGPSRQLTSCASDRVLSTALLRLLDYYMTFHNPTGTKITNPESSENATPPWQHLLT